jgi:hypothetical protein
MGAFNPPAAVPQQDYNEKAYLGILSASGTPQQTKEHSDGTLRLRFRKTN